MKIFTKRIFTVVVACMMACLMSVTPALAAGSFTKTTVKLNAYSGGSSTKSTVTSGTVGNNQSVTKVELRCTVSSGTDPYTLYVKSPEGKTASFTGPLSRETFTTTAFNGENPSGTWTIWIVNNNVSYNGNIYPVSTVTVRIKGFYS